jgi:hypothetical protein
MRRVISMLLVGAGWTAGAAETGSPTTVAEPAVVEILRYETPELATDDVRSRALEPGVEPYLIVVNVEAGRRFVSARVAVHDGLLAMPRRRGAWDVVGRFAARLGYEVATQEAPPGVRETLRALAGTLPELDPPAETKPRLRRRITLEAGDVEHHAGYVATVLFVAGSPLTRVEVGDIVSRPERSGRGRMRASTVVLPHRGDMASSADTVRSVLAGRRGTPPGRRAPP